MATERGMGPLLFQADTATYFFTTSQTKGETEMGGNILIWENINSCHLLFPYANYQEKCPRI
jgi:hypothetical protein